MNSSSPRYTLRTRGGALEAGSLARLDGHRVFVAEPRREFPWHRGQRHYPGRYWAATTEAFVGYESRLELVSLLLEDFDPTVTKIASQPFELVAEHDGRPGSHVPDYMVAYRDGSFGVIDVKPAKKLELPEVREALEWAGQLIVARGWSYRIVSEPDPILLSNMRFLAGYRRRIQFPTTDTDRAVEATTGARTVGEAFRLAGVALDDHPYARAVVLHLLWTQVLKCDLAGGVLGRDTELETA